MINGVLPDPRLHAYRDDLAAESLRGRVHAPHYVKGKPRQVEVAVLPLRREPRFDAELASEALLGERATVYDEREGWAFVQLDRDSYVGYLPSEGLSSSIAVPTHRVAALRTFIFPEPDIKAPPIALLSLNAQISVSGEHGRFLVLSRGGHVFADHVRPLAWKAPDYVTVAQSFIGTPYLWGGRTSLGLDCSALVQLSLEAAGVSCPRDSDLQAASIGKVVPNRQSGLQRGDLIFWDGHVGIMLDPDILLHANVHHMAVEAEPLVEAMQRIETATGGEIASVRRLSAISSD